MIITAGKLAIYLEARVGIEPTNKGFADLVVSEATSFVCNQILTSTKPLDRSRTGLALIH
jgi:hypothetical protein